MCCRAAAARPEVSAAGAARPRTEADVTQTGLAIRTGSRKLNGSKEAREVFRAFVDRVMIEVAT